jgi:hypothetical protein
VVVHGAEAGGSLAGERYGPAVPSPRPLLSAISDTAMMGVCVCPCICVCLFSESMLRARFAEAAALHASTGAPVIMFLDELVRVSPQRACRTCSLPVHACVCICVCVCVGEACTATPTYPRTRLPFPPLILVRVCVCLCVSLSACACVCMCVWGGRVIGHALSAARGGGQCQQSDRRSGAHATGRLRRP